MRYAQDNIVAIATSMGQAGIGVVRISGTNLAKLLKELTGKVALQPRYAYYADFYTASKEIIDSGLVIFFARPKSFTGEEVVELQAHGSPVALNMLLKRCLELKCRLAAAGEFSQRAYLNGKLDLVQAESIADLIHAESEACALGAVKSLKGEFSRKIQVINEQLINLRMYVEATLDFPEEDIEFIVSANVKAKLEVLRTAIIALLANAQQGAILNNGANVVIVGRPNVGKSSLLNALAEEEVAIVTAVAGTTRDLVRQKVIIDGVHFNIIDTAGIHATNDIVEKIGIERAIAAVTSADLCMILIDDTVGISAEDNAIISLLPIALPKVYVHNKIDLSQQAPRVCDHDGLIEVYLSARTKSGIELLQHKLLELVGWEAQGSNVFIARTRHLEAMRLTVAHIEQAFNCWEQLEIVAEELRYAHSALSMITGEFSADDLLGEIFSKFCIGK